MLDTQKRIVHLHIYISEKITLNEICIDKENGWMPYNGTIKVNGIATSFPAALNPGDNFITLSDPFVGIGVYLKGYDFINTLDFKVIDSSMAGGIGGDEMLRGVQDITTEGTEILLPFGVIGNYEVAKLWCIDATGVDRSVQFYNKTQNSFWAKSLRTNAKLCWIGFRT